MKRYVYRVSCDVRNKVPGGVVVENTIGVYSSGKRALKAAQTHLLWRRKHMSEAERRGCPARLWWVAGGVVTAWTQWVQDVRYFVERMEVK